MNEPVRLGAHRRAQRARRAGYCYLLDADSDLADEFDLRMRIAVRQVATAVVVDLPVGRSDIAQLAPNDQQSLGLLLLDGMIAVDVQVGERTSTELVGPGDLLQASDFREEALIARQTAWRALLPTRVALLDGPFAERVRPWPQIALAFLRRLARRADDARAQRAIASEPRLEVRLVLLLWHLAERWGRVDPGGVRLSLPLTHALLGRLVGAERPSVSRVLSRLAAAELVVGGAGDWHLTGSLESHLAALATGPRRPQQPIASGNQAVANYLAPHAAIPGLQPAAATSSW
jgi:CRP-like cAMP-binding protein